MSRYGWAYVNSIVTGAAVIGPDRGVVLNEGGYASASTNFQFSGSTGSINGQLNVTGNVIISGTLFAEQYSSTVVSSSIIYTSGSTKFGDDNTDTHQFTGSIFNTTLVSSSLGQYTTLTASNARITGSAFDINGGAIDNTTIGTSVQSTGRFTTLSASSTLNVVGNTNLQSLTASGVSSSGVGNFGSIVVTNVLNANGNVFLGDVSSDVITVNGQITGSNFDINGGTIDNTPINASTIGASVQSSGRFTTLSASSTLNVVGISTLQTVTASAVSSSGVLNVNGITTLTTLTASNGGRFTGGKKVEVTDAAGTTVKVSLDGNTGEVSGSSNFTVGGQLTVQAQATFNAGATGSAFDINGGTIDNTAIGTTVSSSGKFTTLSASSTLDIAGNTTIAGNATIIGNLTVSGNMEFGNATTDQINVNGDLVVDDTTNLNGGVNFGSATVYSGTAHVAAATDSVIVLTNTGTVTLTLASQSVARMLFIIFQGASTTGLSIDAGSSSGIVDTGGITQTSISMTTTNRVLMLMYNTNDNKYYVVSQV